MSRDRLLLMRVVEKAGPRGPIRGLVPASADSRAALDGYNVHERVWCQVDRSRSLPQHRLFRKLLEVVANGTAYETADRLLVALKVRLGKFDLVQVPDRPEPVPVLHSTSFSGMKAAEFTEFMKNSIEIICTEVLGGYDQAQLLSEVQALIDHPTSPQQIESAA